MIAVSHLSDDKLATVIEDTGLNLQKHFVLWKGVSRFIWLPGQVLLAAFILHWRSQGRRATSKWKATGTTRLGLSLPWICEDFTWSCFSKLSWLLGPFSNMLGKVLDPISCPYGAWRMFVAKGEMTQIEFWSGFKRTELPSKSPAYPRVSCAHFSGFAMQNEQCFSCGD